MSSDVSMLLPIPKQLREFLIQQSWTHSRDRSSTGRNVDRSHTCMPITNAKNCSRFAREKSFPCSASDLMVPIGISETILSMSFGISKVNSCG